MKNNNRRRYIKLSFLVDAVSYRIALPVIKLVRFPVGGYTFPLCPRCKMTMDREYMRFCDRCGQKLNWDFWEDAEIVDAPFVK